MGGRQGGVNEADGTLGIHTHTHTHTHTHERAGPENSHIYGGRQESSLGREKREKVSQKYLLFFQAQSSLPYPCTINIVQCDRKTMSASFK